MCVTRHGKTSERAPFRQVRIRRDRRASAPYLGSTQDGGGDTGVSLRAGIREAVRLSCSVRGKPAASPKASLIPPSLYCFLKGLCQLRWSARRVHVPARGPRKPCRFTDGGLGLPGA